MKKYLPPEMEINLFDENEGLIFTASMTDEECKQLQFPDAQAHFYGSGIDWGTPGPGSDGSARDPFDPVFRQNTNTILGNDKK